MRREGRGTRHARGGCQCRYKCRREVILRTSRDQTKSRTDLRPERIVLEVGAIVAPRTAKATTAEAAAAEAVPAGIAGIVVVGVVAAVIGLVVVVHRHAVIHRAAPVIVLGALVLWMVVQGANLDGLYRAGDSGRQWETAEGCCHVRLERLHESGRHWE